MVVSWVNLHPWCSFKCRKKIWGLLNVGWLGHLAQMTIFFLLVVWSASVHSGRWHKTPFTHTVVGHQGHPSMLLYAGCIAWTWRRRALYEPQAQNKNTSTPSGQIHNSMGMHKT